MSKLILIRGLPCSGKSYLGERMLRDGQILHFYDDIPSVNELNKDISTDFAIADVHFCDDNVLSMAMTKLFEIYPFHKIKIVEFENNVKKCLKNLKYRKSKGDKRIVTNMIKIMAGIYQPTSPIDIWTPINSK